MSDRAQFLAQIEKLILSASLHGSESLCKLLRYLGTHALDHPGTPLKEYQIATEVFARSEDFDPQLDSMVRVQAGRLRAKLAEYYANEGADDAIWVELPKGTYLLSFRQGPPGTGKNLLAAGHDADRDSNSTRQIPRKWAIAVGVLAVLLATMVTVVVVLLIPGKPAANVTAEERIHPVFSIFWKGFLTSSEEPWVIFSNAAFVGRPDTGMRYYDSARDSRALILDHYTGVGEVLAVHELDEVFRALHQRIRVKRGSLFSLDDAKNNDLIFIGSPSENLTLLEIPGTHEFIFKQDDSGPRKGNMKIVNAHPQSGEPKEFLATASNQPLTEDYSVIALLRGLNPDRSVLILAGTTTIGTQAAVEFISRQNSLEQLLLRLSVSKSGELKPFEAVIREKVVRGVPVGAELVALRKGT